MIEGTARANLDGLTAEYMTEVGKQASNMEKAYL